LPSSPIRLLLRTRAPCRSARSIERSVAPETGTSFMSTPVSGAAHGISAAAHARRVESALRGTVTLTLDRDGITRALPPCSASAAASSVLAYSMGPGCSWNLPDLQPTLSTFVRSHGAGTWRMAQAHCGEPMRIKPNQIVGLAQSTIHSIVFAALHLAARVRDAYSSAEAAPWLAVAAAQEGRTLSPLWPLLDSSDALDVVVAACLLPAPAGGGCLVWCGLSPQVLCPVPFPSSGVPCCSVTDRRCGCCCRWSRCVRLGAPPCAHLFGPRVSAVRRPFPPGFILFLLSRRGFTWYTHVFHSC
jgi:hypothetical protein